jgi:hypothetical protein
MPYNREVVALPNIESNKTYAPNEFAFEITNLQLSPDGTLMAVRGPTPYTYYDFPGRIYGVFHALLDNGTRDVLLVRAGDGIYEQTGWEASGWTKVHSNIQNVGNYKYPDQFADVGGRIIWTNGYDSAVIYDGYTKHTTGVGVDPLLMPLGFDRVPSVPMVLGPIQETNKLRATNSAGYSHPGNIGTFSSALTVTNGAADSTDAAVSWMLAGSWQYAVQFEDCFGNLSAISSGADVHIHQEQTRTKFLETYIGFFETYQDLGPGSITHDDLSRQFWVDNIAIGPNGTVARRVYRTRDTLHSDNNLRFLCRIPDNETTSWPDEMTDGFLGEEAEDRVSVPAFKVMSPYQGGLAIGNTLANPGIVWVSDPGFPGSFKKERYIYPDSNGSEVTGLSNFQGKLIAFTQKNMYAITEASDGALLSYPITNGIGCVAPSSIVSTAFNELVWLGRDGFYSYDGNDVKCVSLPIDPLIRKLSWQRATRSVAVYNRVSREYMCAVCEAGSSSPNLILCYDGQGWREQRHNLLYNSLCVTKDEREYVLGGSQTSEGVGEMLMVLDHETRDYPTPITTFSYKSRWLKIDGAGLTRFNVATLFVGFLESANASVTVNCYRNGRWDDVIATGELTMVADDRAYVFETSVLGTATTLSPRLYWKRFDMQLRSVDSFAFELVGAPESGQYINIASFAFDGVVAADRGARISRG